MSCHKLLLEVVEAWNEVEFQLAHTQTHSQKALELVELHLRSEDWSWKLIFTQY